MSIDSHFPASDKEILNQSFRTSIKTSPSSHLDLRHHLQHHTSSPYFAPYQPPQSPPIDTAVSHFLTPGHSSASATSASQHRVKHTGFLVNMPPKKLRCTFKECKEQAQRIVGDCGFCQGHYCGKHRLLEDHKCSGLEDCKKQSKDMNTAKLESERTQVLRGI